MARGRRMDGAARINRDLYEFGEDPGQRGSAFRATACTSSWVTSTILPGTPRSGDAHGEAGRPHGGKTITGAVLMPTASAPMMRIRRYSAGVSARPAHTRINPLTEFHS